MQQARQQLMLEFPELQAKKDSLDDIRKAQGLFYKPD
jgi:hypothetical protein